MTEKNVLNKTSKKMKANRAQSKSENVNVNNDLDMGEMLKNLPHENNLINAEDIDFSASSAPVENVGRENNYAIDPVMSRNIELLMDVSLPLSIELGRTKMPISEILELGPGSVVELNKLAGEPVDLLVNQKVIAKGEVVVIDENFGVRVTQLLNPDERLKALGEKG